jgi:GNAT superfamily N-acetyltransferase
MRADDPLVAAGILNMIAAFRTLARHAPGGEIRDSGGVFGFTTGAPVWLFNGIVVVDDPSPKELRAAVHWIQDRAVPFGIWLLAGQGRGIEDLLVGEGLELMGEPHPAMVLHPVPEAPPSAPGVTVEPVDEANLHEFIQVMDQGGFPAAVANRLFGPAFAADPDVQLFLARLDGRPVGTSLAVRSPDATGVYAVGTLEDARRRGVGSASTWAAVAAGRAWGAETIVLDSSEIGFGVYSAMGFRMVARYAVYGPPTHSGT